MKQKPLNSIWTDKQWEAVVISGTNVLVSAGAGSGKTAVLTERILEKLKDGINIDELLVLTFTNAAASEMKERVRKKLKKEVNDFPLLKKQLEKIDEALITTFDSFCMFLVQKYYYKLDISNKIGIVDSLFISQKKYEIMTEIFERKFSSEEKGFIDLVDTYTIDTDKMFKEKLIALHTKYVQLINFNDVDKYFTNEFIMEKESEYLETIQLKVNSILSEIKKYSQYNFEGVLDNYIEKISEKYIGYQNATTYKLVKNALEVSMEYKNPRLPNKNKLGDYHPLIVECRDRIKKLEEQIESMLIYEDISDLSTTYLSTKESAKVIISIIKQFDKELYEYKREINSFEFIDINLFALKILEENQEVCNEYKNQLHEILIDEYQDTNDIQEKTISYITDNNLYMVGDIKQAIYGFRNANPNIFKEKYLNYQKNNDGVLIDLNKNFRSRKEVLSNINIIFERIMDEELGAVNYEDKQRLEFGNMTYEDNKVNYNTDMQIITYDEKEVKENDMKPSEFEIHQIAMDIKDKINNKYEVLEKGTRPCKLSDFAILTETKSTHKKIQEIFEMYGLNVLIKDFSDSYSTSKEIVVIKHALNLVNILNNTVVMKKELKYSIAAFLRSYLFEYNDDDIYEIVSKINEMIYEDGFEIIDLYNFLKQTNYYQEFEILINLCNDKENLTINEILCTIINKLKVLEKIYKLESPIVSEQRIFNILKVSNFFDENFLNIDDMINYMFNIEFEKKLDSVKSKNDIAFNYNENSTFDAVNVMTIHKSKGLEFPICYFMDWDKKFNIMDLTTSEILDIDYGLILKYRNKNGNLSETFIKPLYREKYIKDMVGEKIRLLYVALTRAKEHFIIFSKVESQKSASSMVLPIEDRIKYSKFSDILESIFGDLRRFVKYQNFNIPDDINNSIDKIEHDSSIEVEFKKVNKEFKQISKKNASMKINEILDNKTKKNIQKGNELHLQLEFIDFSNLDNAIEKSGKELKITLQQIKKIVSNEKNCKFYTEFEFQYINKNNEEVLGIIDLLVESNDKFYIIDYKLNDIHKPEYEKQLHTYKDYIESISEKEVKMFLLSITTGEIKELGEKNEIN